jgi:hypothetical protein
MTTEVIVTQPRQRILVGSGKPTALPKPVCGAEKERTGITYQHRYTSCLPVYGMRKDLQREDYPSWTLLVQAIMPPAPYANLATEKTRNGYHSTQPVGELTNY